MRVTGRMRLLKVVAQRKMTVSLAAARGAAENTEFGAMRMIEVDGVAGSSEGCAEVEFWVVGQ